MPDTRKAKETLAPAKDTAARDTAGRNTAAPNEGAEAPPQNEMQLMMMRMQEQQAMMQQQFQQQMTQIMNLTTSLLSQRSEPTPEIRARRPERPTIDMDSTDTEWNMFLDDWQRYKQMSMLATDEDIRNELRSTCSKEVRTMLFNFIGSEFLVNASEVELVAYIKSVAVRSVHKEVHRQEFRVLRQEEGENITGFAARLKAKAIQCKFDSGKCTSKCSYADEMISSQIISGVRNSDHRGKVLAEMDALDALPKLIERLLVLECTQKASKRFVDSPRDSPRDFTDGMVAAQKSSYRKFQSSQGAPPSRGRRQTGSRNQFDGKPRCKGCGMRSHGPGKTMVRDQNCPAWGRKCHNCQQENHFKSVCRGEKSQAAAVIDEDLSEDEQDVSFLSATRSRSDSI